MESSTASQRGSHCQNFKFSWKMTFDRRFIEIDFQRDYFIEVDYRPDEVAQWKVDSGCFSFNKPSQFKPPITICKSISTFKMDSGKIAQEALTYAKGLAEGNASKSPLIAAAEKWIADHSKNPMSMAAMGDVKKIQVSNRHYNYT